jgi:hypothetical protein
VPSALHRDAKRAFAAINRVNPEEAEVMFALEFFKKKATFLRSGFRKLDHELRWT